MPFVKAVQGGSLSILRLLVRGSAWLGVAVLLHRALSFLGNSLAARLAGPEEFGAYSLILSTAAMVAGYSALGVGTTASHFGGRFSRDQADYARFLRILAVLLAASSAIVLLVLGAGSSLLGLFLQSEQLIPLLRIAVLSALVLVGYEAFHGLLLGSLSFAGLWRFSLLTGLGLFLGLWWGSFWGAAGLVWGHALGMGAGLLVALFLNWPALSPAPRSSPSCGANLRLRDVVPFGATQLGATALITLASWWVALLLARSEASLTQMGFYAVGNQLRGLAAALPLLLTQLVLPLLGHSSCEEERRRVVSVSTRAAALASVLSTGVLLLFLPQVLGLYGGRYQEAYPACVLLILTAAAQVCGGPTASYLLTVDLRLTALVTLAGSLVLSLLALKLVPSWGATGAGAAWLAAQVTAQVFAFALLIRLGKLHWRVCLTWALSLLICLLAGMLALLKGEAGSLIPWLTLGQLLLLGSISYQAFRMACQAELFPVGEGLRRLLLLRATNPLAGGKEG